MELKKTGHAGTMESGDVYVVIRPNPGKGISISLESVVKRQFGEAIVETTARVLKELEVADAVVEISDRGALDSVIRARVQAAVCRAAETTQFDWGRAL